MLTVTLLLFVLLGSLAFCPKQNKLTAFIWICSLWFSVSAPYTIFPAALSRAFGDRYCGVLTGMVMLSEIAATAKQSGFFSIIEAVDIREADRWKLRHPRELYHFVVL